MTDEQHSADGLDTNRSINRARAALREAAETLDDAATASEHPSVGVMSALSHVAAARKAIGLYGHAESGDASERDAA